MRWLVLLALVAGCRKEPRGASRQPAPPDAGPDTCVETCVKQNQMRATSIEQIEADCRAQCASAAPTP